MNFNIIKIGFWLSQAKHIIDLNYGRGKFSIVLASHYLLNNKRFNCEILGIDYKWQADNDLFFAYWFDIKKMGLEKTIVLGHEINKLAFQNADWIHLSGQNAHPSYDIGFILKELRPFAVFSGENVDLLKEHKDLNDSDILTSQNHPELKEKEFIICKNVKFTD